MTTGATVYTIGHSRQPIASFIDTLRQHGATAVVDVRSAPYSRFNPQFNKASLERSLETHGITYVFLGRELGARSEDRSCYEKGRVRYGRLAQTDLFLLGIEHVIREAREHRLALMCAEREPLDCHRSILIARVLVERGVDVEHILADGRSEPHRHTVERLLDLTGLPHEDLFLSKDELIAQAMAKQEERIAYTLPQRLATSRAWV